MPAFAIHIDNLKCGGCESTIRRKLGEISGVSTVVIDPAAAEVTVVHDGTVMRDEVAQVLFHLGYPEHGTGGIVEKAKSYVSCAIGRVNAEP